MNKNIDLVNINLLKMHERTNPKRLSKIFDELKSLGYLKNPIIIDKKTYVILDGHHRFSALRKLGIRKIPCFLVDYQSRQIRVFLRRKTTLTKLLKEVVINKGLTQKLLPYKTTRHFLPFRPRHINIKLANLFY